MLRKPPHILVTTPESLFILLTAERSRRAARRRRARSSSTRSTRWPTTSAASHLALSLARLDALVAAAAAQAAAHRPLGDGAADRGGRATSLGAGRACDRRRRPPARDGPGRRGAATTSSGAVATNEMWAEIYDRIADTDPARTGRRCLRRTRAGWPSGSRITLAQRLGEDVVLPHHGSLSRDAAARRRARLKEGELRAVVATASLELGIDIGTVDLVVPDRLAAIDRRRRCSASAGRATGSARRRRACFRDDARRADRVRGAGARDPRGRARRGSRSRRRAARHPGAADRRRPALRRLGRGRALRARPRARIPTATCRAATSTPSSRCSSDGIATSRGRSGAHPAPRSRERHACAGGAARASPRSPPAARSPTTPTTRSSPSPKAQSSARSTRTSRSRAWPATSSCSATLVADPARRGSGEVRVEDAHGAPPTIPFWLGEAPGAHARALARGLALRERLDDRAGDAQRPSTWLERECGLDRRRRRAGASRTCRPARPRSACVPTHDDVVAERFFDEAGGMQLVLHAPFGGAHQPRVGPGAAQALLPHLRLRAAGGRDRRRHRHLARPSSTLPARGCLRVPARRETSRDVLTQALLDAPMFGDALALERDARRWRCCASAAGARCRRRFSGCAPTTCWRRCSRPGGVPGEPAPGRSRIPDHPLVRETIDNCLHEAMDVDGLQRRASRDSSAARFARVAVDTAEPSAFSHEILNANPYAFLDDAPLEERRTRAVQLRRGLRAGRRRRRRRSRSGGHRGGGGGSRGRSCATPTSCTTRC